MKSVVGNLSLHYEGYGFVVPLKPGLPDVFVPARFMEGALHGDLVQVSVKKGKRGLSEGKIEKVLERGMKQLAGRLELAGKKWVVLSDDQRVRHPMVVGQPPSYCKHGDTVVAKVTQYPAGKRPLEGKIIEKLPKRGTLKSEVEYVIAKHQLAKSFPENVEKEAKGIHQKSVLYSKEEGRKDLRKLPFVTIDGEDAKDFDDAVCAEKLANGDIRVWVAIADVSHYVRPGTLLDQEAYARATSVYFPGRVLPMLPEALSNDLCSLRPDEDRLAMTAEWVLNAKGEVVEETFYPSIFKSHARLTYTIVRRLLLDREEGVREEYRFILPRVELLSEAAKRIHAVREKRGSLDFDLPEPEIILDMTGGIEHIEKTERNWSHQIIEELMIAANEAVARFLTKTGRGCLYRVHENPDPDKIRNFYKTVQRLGYKGEWVFPPASKSLQKILNFFKDHPEERLINTLMLRSMSQAVYSEENLGHFGLGSECYCHFTSPIRRYPDLAVHRLLKAVFARQNRGLNKKQLSETAGNASRQERRALEAEREIIALHRALFMQDKIGEEFNGIISHITKFGFFVELLDYFVEGLVPKESLTEDRFVFDPDRLHLEGKRSKKRFKIGDKIRVSVEDVKLAERRIFLKLLDN